MLKAVLRSFSAPRQFTTYVPKKPLVFDDSGQIELFSYDHDKVLFP